jgi:putative ABC transport system permease protein
VPRLPWSRAPKAALGSPVTVLVAVVTGLVMAFVVASAVLYVSASGSAAAGYAIDARCYGETGLRVTRSEPARQDAATDRRVLEITAAHGADHVLRTDAYLTSYLGAPGTPTLQLLSRDEAFNDLRVLRGGGTDGAWIPDDFAAQYGIAPGARLPIATGSGVVPVPVAAVYERPADPVSPLWCSVRDLMVLNPLVGEAPVPPPAAILTPEALRELSGHGLAPRLSQMDITTRHLAGTGTGISAWADSVAAMRAELLPALGQRVTTTDNARAIADTAARTRDTVRAAVLPLTLVSLLAGLLGVVGLAIQWTQRRSSELTLLYVRGVSPAAIGGKAVLELGTPLLAGVALGLLAAWLAVPALAPADQIEAVAVWLAAGCGAGTWLLALGALAATVVLRVRRRFAPMPRTGQVVRRIPRYLPWEVLAAAGAAVAWADLSAGAVVVGGDLQPKINLLALAFPLLCLAALVGLVARVGAVLVRTSHRLRRWRNPAVLWALRRTAAQRRVTIALLTVAGLAVGVISVGLGVSWTARDSITAKGLVLVGSDHAITLKRSADAWTEVPEPVRDRATRIARTEMYIRTNVPARFTMVDPGTFAHGARWRDSWGDTDLGTLMRTLDDAANAASATGDRTVPVIVVGPYPLSRFVRGSLPPMRAVATVPTFPGMGHSEGMLVASWRSVSADVLRGYAREVLTRGDPETVTAALNAAGERTGSVFSASRSTEGLPFLIVGWIFAFYVVLGAALVVIAVAMLAVSVETRRRSTAVGHALLTRMGLRARSLFATHATELALLAGTACAVGLAGGWTILRLSVSHLDPYPLLSPLPVPSSLVTLGLVTLGACAFGVAVIAGYAMRAAGRASVRELLRA